MLSVSWRLCTLLLKAFGCSGLLPRRIGAVEMGTKWHLFESFSLWHWPFRICITNSTLYFSCSTIIPVCWQHKEYQRFTVMITLRNQSDSLLNHFYKQIIFSPIIMLRVNWYFPCVVLPPAPIKASLFLWAVLPSLVHPPPTPTFSVLWISLRWFSS